MKDIGGAKLDKKSTMDVMYASDDNYAEIMGVSILSLLQSNRDVQKIRIFIIEDAISEENKSRLTNMVNEYERDVIFIQKPDIRNNLGVELKTLRWSDSAFSRLFLKELFAPYPDVHKLLYLDCDTLVVADLQDLWNTDISSYLGAACLECMSNLHKKIIGAKKTDNYINTGMLLLNVDRCVKEDVQRQASDFLKKYKGKVEYVDQGVINGTVSNRFLLVDPRYNLTALAYDFTYGEMQIYRKPQFGYSEAEWNKAVSDPAVIHFTTSFLSVRPWYEGSHHPYAATWKQIHDQSPWENYPYRKMKNRESRDRKEQLFRKLPRRLAVRIAGVLHAYVKPIAYLFC